MTKNVSSVLGWIIVALCAITVNGSKTKRHIVGDDTGWSSALPNARFYEEWSAKYNFTVGDVLVFNFTTNFHNVVAVDRASYSTCSTDKSSVNYTVGPVNITLNSSGTSYFLCSYTNHCKAGQKLSVIVKASPDGNSAYASTKPEVLFMSIVLGFLLFL